MQAEVLLESEAYGRASAKDTVSWAGIGISGAAGGGLESHEHRGRKEEQGKLIIHPLHVDQSLRGIDMKRAV